MTELRRHHRIYSHRGMSKDYSDVTRMSVTNPNQFRLRMLWRRCARPVQWYAAPVTAGGWRTGVTPAAICPGALRDPGTGRHRSHSGTPGRDATGHSPGLRDGMAPVTLRDSGTGWHRSHSGSLDGTGPVTLRDPRTGRHRSHSGTPGRDGTGHTPGLRDGTGPVTLRDSGTGWHRSHSGTPRRDGTGHTPGSRDGTGPVTPRDPGTAPVTHHREINVALVN